MAPRERAHRKKAGAGEVMGKGLMVPSPEASDGTQGVAEVPLSPLPTGLWVDSREEAELAVG